LQWDPSAGPNVVGYIVYVRIPGGQGNAYDVGNATSFNWTGAIEGQQYYFAVAAYAPGNVVGARSSEISRYPNRAPALTNPGPQTGTAGTHVTLQLTGNDPDGAGLTYNAANLPPGLSIGGNGAISGSPNTAGLFVVSATITDGELTDTETFTWTIAPAPQDLTPPAVVITVPSAANSPAPAPDKTSRGTTLAERLRAAVQRAPNAVPPSAPPVNGTAGPLTVTATTEAARNTSWGGRAKPATIVTDQPFITLAGSAADDRGISNVEWVTDRGLKGTATGTDTWIAAVPLLPGLNRITVKVRDSAGNVSSTIVPVLYNAGSTLKK
jgi:hypothetical protein